MYLDEIQGETKIFTEVYFLRTLRKILCSATTKYTVSISFTKKTKTSQCMRGFCTASAIMSALLSLLSLLASSLLLPSFFLLPFY